MEFDLYIRIAGSFAIVGLLLWLFSRATRGRLGARLRGSRNRITFDPLVVIERRQLTKSNAVAIVRAGRRHVLVGYGEQGVQLLAEGDDLVEDPAEAVTTSILTPTSISTRPRSRPIRPRANSDVTHGMPHGAWPGNDRWAFTDQVPERTDATPKGQPA